MQRLSAQSENGEAAGGEQEDLQPGLDPKWKDILPNSCAVCRVGHSWGGEIKCLLGSLVNVSNLTLLGKGGGGVGRGPRKPGDWAP